jgi:ATP/maltotriose-dependent transcriptional regulator MalT
VALLTTKLHVPPLRTQLVERPRLVERLEQGLRLGHKLALISAAAGFGKTTLVSEWQHSRRGTTATVPFTWLSLDENDPARLLAYLLAALQKIDPAIGQAALANLQASQPLAQESFPYVASDFQALIRISQHLQQRPFKRRFYHGREHLPELRLSHSRNRLGSHLAILSGNPPEHQASRWCH